MFGSRRFRLIGLTAVLSVVAVSCSSGDEAAAPTATSSDPDLPTSPTATAIVARTTPTPDASGSPTPVAHRPPVRVEIPPTGPTTTADGLTVQEVLRRSKEHALAATSFRSRSVPPESHGAEARERSRASFIEYVAPDMQRRIGSDGEVDMIVVGDALYRPSSNDDGKWWISEGFQGFVAAALPTRMIPFDLAGASFIDLGDPEYFVIQGYANSLYRVGASPLPGTDTPKLHELRIRKDSSSAREAGRSRWLSNTTRRSMRRRCWCDRRRSWRGRRMSGWRSSTTTSISTYSHPTVGLPAPFHVSRWRTILASIAIRRSPTC